MAELSEIKDAIRDFILTRYLHGESPDNVRDRTRLQTSGLLDSLALLELVSFVERRFGIEVTASDRTADRFDRIEDIAALIVEKAAR
jgi:acyl carrier protein